MTSHGGYYHYHCLEQQTEVGSEKQVKNESRVSNVKGKLFYYPRSCPPSLLLSSLLSEDFRGRLRGAIPLKLVFTCDFPRNPPCPRKTVREPLGLHPL